MLVWQARHDAKTELPLLPLLIVLLLALHLAIDGAFVYLSVAQLALYALIALSAAGVALSLTYAEAES